MDKLTDADVEKLFVETQSVLDSEWNKVVLLVSSDDFANQTISPHAQTTLSQGLADMLQKIEDETGITWLPTAANLNPFIPGCAP